MGLLNNNEKELIELQTLIKLMREDNEKMKSSIHTLTKHVKFLVHMARTVNPNLPDPEDDK